MSNKPDLWSEYSGIFIRVPIAFHLIYGTQDNVFSWVRMLEFRDFLESFGFPIPLVSAVVSVYLQFLAGILYFIGWKVKYAAIVMILNFVIAILMVHWQDPYPRMFPAIMMLCASAYLLLAKPDRLSLDAMLRRQSRS